LPFKEYESQSWLLLAIKTRIKPCPSFTKVCFIVQ
jgi:hypothetical protein